MRQLHVRRAADALAFTAAPTFALMALMSGALEGSPGAMCGAPEGARLAGMTSMYLLMSVFHAGPWLRLVSRNGAA